MRLECEIFADYHQFYLQDEGASGDLSSAWTEEATAKLFAVVPGCVGVGTVTNEDVPVVVEILGAAPGDDFEGVDLVNEASLDVPSGKVVIAGCTDYLPEARRIPVEPGRYRLRVLYRLAGGESYQILLWPAADAIEPRTVIDRR